MSEAPDPGARSFEEAMKLLCEHWDTVLIIASRHEGDTTHRKWDFTGNVYANTELARAFTAYAQANTDALELEKEDPNQ